MQRKVFDVIASAGGAVMVIVLLVAGVLLMWGYSFANSNVHKLSGLNRTSRSWLAAQPSLTRVAGAGEVTPSMVGTGSKRSRASRFVDVDRKLRSTPMTSSPCTSRRLAAG